MAEISLSEFNNQQPKAAPKKQLPDSRIGLAVAVAVVVAGISFFAGVQYQKGKAPSTSSRATASQSGSQARFGSGGFQRGNRAFGTVSAVSSSSITIQSRSGSSSTYNITSSTTVTDNGQSSSVSAIQTGSTVIMTLDSSNTKDVTSIMLNPSFGGGFGGGAPTSPDSSGSNTSGSDTTGSATGA